jgi:hypothetical protein
MAVRSSTKSTNTLQSKQIRTFNVTTTNIDIKCEQISNILKDKKRKIVSPETLKEEFLDLMKEYDALATGGTTRKKFGDCKCVHPPSFGHCIFGACVSVFRTGLTITINI